MTETIAEPISITELLPYEETDDPDTKTHIINHAKNWHIAPVDLTARELVDFARMAGVEVEALCGYRWVPKLNPDKYPPCKACFKIAEQIMKETGI